MYDFLRHTVAFLVLFLLEVSLSGFLFHDRVTYFFFFSFLIALAVHRGFLRALPVIVLYSILFEGLIAGRIGAVSLYALLATYGSIFVLRRINFDQTGGRWLFAFCAGIGMVMFPIFSDIVSGIGSWEKVIDMISIRTVALIFFGGGVFLCCAKILELFGTRKEVLGSTISV